MFFKFFGSKRLLVLLASIILLVTVMGVTLGNQNHITWPEKFIKDVTAWGQTIIYRPANMVAGFFEDIHDFSVMYEENKMLKQSLHTQAQMEAKQYGLVKENERLKQALGFKTKANNYELRMASVVGRNPDHWNNMIVIDKGSKDGVKPNMGVISADGSLIGRVHATSPYSAQVQLVSDTDQITRISAIVQNDDLPFGIIEGYDDETGMLTLTKIPLYTKLKKGDKVVTAGLADVFPPDIVIGEIEEVRSGDFGLTQNA
ncbi:MAG: rod shape-determining protein MreC, partial [Bacilli bacterium]